MKLIRQTLLAAGASALLAFAASPIRAADVPAPANGDLFLGVRTTPGVGAVSTSYLVNLGPSTLFRNAAPGATLSPAGLEKIGQDLAATFGSDWQTRTDLQWGVFGTSASASSVVFGSRKQDPVGTFATPWAALDATARNGTSSVIAGVIFGIGGYRDGASTANTAAATLQVNSTSSSSYYKQVAAEGTTDFGSLSEWLSIEAPFGPDGSALDLFRIDAAGVTNLGTFKFTASGKLKFTGHIENNASPVIKFADDNFSVKESDGVATLTLERLGDASSTASVEITTSNGSAIAGTDYTAQTGVVVNFAANQTIATATVPVASRPGTFADRSFTVALLNVTGAAIVGPSTTTVTISDVGEFAFDTTSVNVRALTNDNPALVTLTVNRSGAATGAATVDVAVTGGSLTNGTDYDSFVPTTVSFADGQSSKTVDIQLHSIAVNSLPGTIILGLSNPAAGYGLGVNTAATVTVLPNTGEISFSDGVYAVSALNASNSPSLINVSLVRDNGSTGPVAVTVTATGGTLTQGTHFTFVNSTTVTFAAGATTANVPIQLGVIPSQTGTIELTLSNPTGYASLGLAETTVSVSGAAGILALSASSSNEFEATPAHGISLRVVRSGGNSGAVSVKVSTTDGTAVSTGGAAVQDFTPLTNYTIQLADGVNSAEIPITIFNTVANEPNETFTVALSNPSGTTLGTPATATVYILDADSTKPTLTVTAPVDKAKIQQGASVHVTGNAADNKGVEKVEVQLNGAAYVSAPLTATAKGFDFDLPITPERGSNTVNVRAVDRRGNVSAVVTRTFLYDDPFTAVAGIYNGLVAASGLTAPSNSTNGLLNVVLLPTGALTGKLTIDGLLLTFAGTLDNEGVARFGANRATTVSVERPNKPSVAVSLQLDLDAPADGKLTGEVKQYYRKILTATSSIDADRAGFDGKTAGTSVAAHYLVNKGAYTLVFPVSESQGDLLPEDYPRGHGIGTLTVKADGTVSLAGTLADNTTVTASAPLSRAYAWPFFAQLYAKQGSIGGKVVLDDGVAHPDDDLSGENIFWFRPYQKVQHYPFGWPEGLTISLFGAKYSVPTDASVLPGLAGTGGNAELTFENGLLEEDVVKNVNIDAGNKVSNVPATDKSFTLKLTPATGLLSGTFTHTDNTKPAFNGVIFQKGGNAGAYGFFLSDTKAKDGLGESGSVTLNAKALVP